MRVIAGQARSLQLKTPKGLDTRPTQDRIKETLFNMIRDYVEDSVFIDIFAGSGGIGIEALSRGAAKAYFLDKSREAISCINDNLKHTHLDENGFVLSGDVFGTIRSIKEDQVDVIFIDPPYEAGYEEKLFSILSDLKFVTSDTIIILESSIEKNFEFPDFEIFKVKEYKTNKHTFFRKKD